MFFRLLLKVALTVFAVGFGLALCGLGVDPAATVAGLAGSVVAILNMDDLSR